MKALKACLDAAEADAADAAPAPSPLSSSSPSPSPSPSPSFEEDVARHMLPEAAREALLFAVALLGGGRGKAAGSGGSPDAAAPGASGPAGRAAVRRYAASVNRFGPSHGALLLPLYGTSELTQARQAPGDASYPPS